MGPASVGPYIMVKMIANRRFRYGNEVLEVDGEFDAVSEQHATMLEGIKRARRKGPELEQPRQKRAYRRRDMVADVTTDMAAEGDGE